MRDYLFISFCLEKRRIVLTFLITFCPGSIQSLAASESIEEGKSNQVSDQRRADLRRLV